MARRRPLKEGDKICVKRNVPKSYKEYVGKKGTILSFEDSYYLTRMGYVDIQLRRDEITEAR